MHLEPIWPRTGYRDDVTDADVVNDGDVVTDAEHIDKDRRRSAMAAGPGCAGGCCGGGGRAGRAGDGRIEYQNGAVTAPNGKQAQQYVHSICTYASRHSKLHSRHSTLHTKHSNTADKRRASVPSSEYVRTYVRTYVRMQIDATHEMLYQ